MQRITLGDFELTAISDGIYHLDGGAFFGVVPKVLWSKRTTVDKDNRVPTGLNSILIRTGKKNVLIETGVGNKLPEKMAQIYGQPSKLLDNLEAVLSAADGILAGLTEKDLERSLVIQDRETTVLSAVYHVVEHFSMHTGQIIFLTKIYAPDKIHFYEDAGALAQPTWHLGTGLDEAAH